VDQLKAYYDGESDTGQIQQCDDIHAVAGLLKLYLRTLPDPLLTFRFYDTFIAVQKNSDFDYRMTNLRKLVNALPKSHKNLLCRLFRFLLRVAAFSEENKMSIQNLAIVFGPNLLRPQDDNVLRIIDDARYVNGITLALLEEFNYLVACTSSTPAAVLAEMEKSEAITTEDGVQLRGELQRSASVRPVSLSRSLSRSITRRGRGFGKFNMEELAEQVAEADREKAEQDALSKEKKLRRLSRDANASTPNLSPLLSALIMTDTPFDLSQPLEFITQQMQISLGSSDPWPSQAIREMSLVQRIEEKALVKGHLRAFDNAYKEANGFLPGKEAKEPLRTVYKRYRDLTRSIEIEKREGPPRAQTPRGQSTRPSLPEMAEMYRPARKKKKSRESKASPKSGLQNNAEYKALKKQKRELQCLLHRFQEDFVMEHGRKVQHAEDRAPIQKEYDAYRDLKSRLTKMEADAASS